MYQILCHPNDLQIERSTTEATAYNSDGDTLFTCDYGWSDEMIRQVLLIANTAHHKGYREGQAAKISELRQALGM